MESYLHCPTCYIDLCGRCERSAISNPSHDSRHRCANGHRMQTIVMKLRSLSGSTRQLERTIGVDVAGGWTPKSADDGSPTALSEDWRKAIGKTMVAVWTRIPDDGVHDELSFPRGAEITEVKEINEDWSFGAYCRMIGLFPSNHVRPVEQS